jgi:hypothetical protein
VGGGLTLHRGSVSGAINAACTALMARAVLRPDVESIQWFPVDSSGSLAELRLDRPVGSRAQGSSGGGLTRAGLSPFLL